MARQLRIQYPGAVYHALSRGDRREPIFADDADRRRFLETQSEVCAKTDWQIHAYCLMGNHFHLVVETPNGSLVAGMLGPRFRRLPAAFVRELEGIFQWVQRFRFEMSGRSAFREIPVTPPRR